MENPKVIIKFNENRRFSPKSHNSPLFGWGAFKTFGKFLLRKYSKPSTFLYQMKNDECVTYFITKNGCKQIWYKDKTGWKQKSGKGIVRKATAEQFLSHLLSALTNEYRNKVWVVVERKLS